MKKGLVDLLKQRQWEGKPGELRIPEAYVRDLKYEIVVFVRKERGGSDFTFRCRKFEANPDGSWLFTGVIIDTSRKGAEGQVEVARLTYHPELVLVSTSFMVIPAFERGD